MKDILFKIIDNFTEGADTYYHNGSMWLIFTDEKKWIIELTKEGTLWYNYYFFHNCFKYVSLDVAENQHYITEWVELFIQNGVKSTYEALAEYTARVESIIQNGVKRISASQLSPIINVESIIQNGVKRILPESIPDSFGINDAIQNGVKETKHNLFEDGLAMEEAIQNGVKRTELGGKDRKIDEIKDIVENGVKETRGLGPSEVTEKEINKVIKETHEDVYQSNARVWGVINNGIKQTIELPDMSGELNGYGEYYARQKDRTYPHTDIVNNVINGK